MKFHVFAVWRFALLGRSMLVNKLSPGYSASCSYMSTVTGLAKSHINCNCSLRVTTVGRTSYYIVRRDPCWDTTDGVHWREPLISVDIVACIG